MFDKNFFKDAFRSWVMKNPIASEEDALAFCQANIPAKDYVSFYWLVEQSLQWMQWLQTQTPAVADYAEDDDYADVRH